MWEDLIMWFFQPLGIKFEGLEYLLIGKGLFVQINFDWLCILQKFDFLFDDIITRKETCLSSKEKSLMAKYDQE